MERSGAAAAGGGGRERGDDDDDDDLGFRAPQHGSYMAPMERERR